MNFDLKIITCVAGPETLSFYKVPDPDPDLDMEQELSHIRKKNCESLDRDVDPDPILDPNLEYIISVALLLLIRMRILKRPC